MSDIAVIGAGAFGTGLALAQAAAGRSVTLWGRNPEEMNRARETRAVTRLPGVTLGPFIKPTSDLDETDSAPVLLLALPAQSLRQFLKEEAPRMRGRTLVACCKGIDLETGLGPWSLIRKMCPDASAAILTGPSFAIDIARGLPTALTLAAECQDLEELQEKIATPTLRLYRSGDVRGAELGGALKNVVAIAAGLAIGAGFGESARAAVMARGFGEVVRLAKALGGESETLFGLSGFGDLVLTCTSEKSRNFSFGQALGRGETFDKSITVEGAATARAVIPLAKANGVEVPLVEAVVEVIENRLTPGDAAEMLLSRPLRSE